MSGSLDERQRTRLYELFVAALELPHDDRAAFCSQECGGDEPLCGELRAMLASVPGQDDAFLEEPALSRDAITDLVDAVHDGVDASPPRVLDLEQVGPYRILERLGDGGMGVVYRAEQSAPVPRHVALKVIKPGMDTERVVRRFDAERQALARMEHPGIARIYDAGATAEGRPWFAMELIGGRPLHEHCRAARLPTRARLELFARLCDAVQHAHQKGVIHRDLKPSNVLITDRSGRPQPVVIDFGIARAIGDRPGDRTQLTRGHELLGTLDYMAPEQAGAQAADVDSRADIYSLGVMLFQLLTGELPFDRSTPVQQRTPHAPSTRVGSNDTTTAAAVSQATDVRGLRRTLRGELDWITIKALETDRERRYASASELAADVRRYLANQPVLAGPPGRWYRLRTFVWRNRLQVVAVAVALLGLLAGSVFAVASSVEARAERDTAQNASDLVLDWIELINLDHDSPARSALLDSAVGRVDAAFGSRPRTEVRLRRVFGEAYSMLGQHDRAVEQLGRALQVLEDLPPEEPVTPAEVLEVLSPYVWPAWAAYPWDKAQSIHRRAVFAAIYTVHQHGHEELARVMGALWYLHEAPARLAKVPELFELAKERCQEDASIWRVFGDFLFDTTLHSQLPEFAGVPAADVERCFLTIEGIYREKVGLRGDTVRVQRLPLFLMQRLVWAASAMDPSQPATLECYRKALALAAKAEPFEDRLPAEHRVRALRLGYHGAALCGLGDFAAGEPKLDASMAMLESLGDMSIETLRLLQVAVGVHASALAARPGAAQQQWLVACRDRLVQLLLSGDFAGVDGDMLRVALGVEGMAFLGELEGGLREYRQAKDPSQLERLLTRCRDLPRPDAEVVAGALVEFVSVNQGRMPAATLIPMARYCETALVDTEALTRPFALWLLARLQNRTGDFEAARETARQLCELPGASRAIDRAGGHLCLAEALQGLGMAGAEDELRAGYRQSIDAVGFENSSTDAAHRQLQDYLLAEGRVQEGVALAQDRLQRLQRGGASAYSLMRAAWTIVRTPAGNGAPAELALQASSLATAVHVHPNPATHVPHVLCLGAALLRCGDAGAALHALDEIDHLPAMDAQVAIACALRAIAHVRLQARAEAEAALGAARAAAEKAGDDFEVGLLVAEAEAAVRGR